MAGNLCGVEDGVDVGHRTEATAASLVVDNPDTFLATHGVCDAVETVNDTSHEGVAPRHPYALLDAEDGEGRQTAVGLNEQPHVFNDDLAVNELQAVEVEGSVWRVEFGLDGGVDSTLDGDFVFQQVVEHSGDDTTIDKRLIECLGCRMEDVSEDAVVDQFVVGIIGLQKAADVMVEET